MMNKHVKYSFLTVFLVFIMSCSGIEEESSSDENSSTIPTVGMLQHTVFFYLNEDVSESDREEFENALHELVDIDVVHKSEVGIPGPTDSRDVTDHDFAYSMYTWFQTLEDYEQYAEHPDHLEFIDTQSDLWSDVKVYDSTITAEDVN